MDMLEKTVTVDDAHSMLEDLGAAVEKKLGEQELQQEDQVQAQISQGIEEVVARLTEKIEAVGRCARNPLFLTYV